VADLLLLPLLLWMSPRLALLLILAVLLLLPPLPPLLGVLL
jgi:hypothetical protein